jgi:hypothetical protein
MHASWHMNLLHLRTLTGEWWICVVSCTDAYSSEIRLCTIDTF